jgi:sugar phosphate isomerase/epimerase
MTPQPHRRQVLRTLAAAGLAPLAAVTARAQDEKGSEGRRRFTMDLTPGMIGVREPFPKVVALAAEHGFESVAPDAGFLGGLSDDDREAFLADMKTKGLVWGAAGLPVDFRGDDEAFASGMKDLPNFAQALQRAGVTRVGTWLRPTHNELTYVRNLRQHVRRLREVATVLGDHGLRFGLEYVGPKTSWTAGRYPFVHTMAETRDLIALIDRPNVGLVLDSWHWYTAGDSEADLLELTNDNVVACDLNDAPAGLAVDEQIDSRRELPMATGVIDLKTFLNALVQIGYDGPVRAEPFKAELRELPAEQAVARTAEAMKAAFALVG